jgi:predicted AAA+ superfamily ATPase
MFKRSLILPSPLGESFFLWGPRQAGKSTLLHQSFPDAFWIDLLLAEEYRRYLQNPEFLRSELAAQPPERSVIIDEVQKVPQLLDEVHWLIENRGTNFVLCGSSARKVKRGHANLLGGRALRRELLGLTARETADRWDLTRMLNHGYLPKIYLSDRPRPLLNAYVADYLKEEIATEGLVRNLPVYSEFLNIASLSDTELVNFSTIARDCGVSSHTIQGYFQILVDTLLGRWLPAFHLRPKRRVISAPKFYFSDVGVVNFLAKRWKIEPGSADYGKAFENWIFHELCAYNSYSESFADLFYWRLASGVEVDFIINNNIAIEAKATGKVTKDHLKGLREIAIDQPQISKRFVVCLETKPRITEDGIKILPAHAFVKLLEEGEIF